jgi:hypothetical protein
MRELDGVPEDALQDILELCGALVNGDIIENTSVSF